MGGKTIQKLQLEIRRINKIIDFLRRLLGLQTKIEMLRTEIMVRQIAAQEGVNPDLIAAVIWCESGMNPKAVNKNPNGTTDYGLCQFNDYWYRDVISPEEALNNPQKAVRIMCRKFAEGRGSDWICYRTQKYLQWYKKAVV